MGMGTRQAGGLWFSFSVAVVTLFAAGAAAAQDSILHFEASTPIAIGTKPVVVTVFSDSPHPLGSLSAAAALDPAAEEPDGPLQTVPVEVDAGAGFVPARGKQTFPAAGRIRVRLERPSGARPGATGWLTVTAESAGDVLVARRAIVVEPSSLKPAVTTWKVTSVQRWPLTHKGGRLGSALPLASSCVDETGPSGRVVDRDKTIAITSTCTGGRLRLNAERYPQPGTYSGKLEVGATPVELEVRRTMTVWWPVLMILIGFLLALWTQGQLDSGLRVGQRLLLARLPGRAADADVKYAQKADGTPWEPYELEPAVTDETASLSHEIDKVRQELLPLLRWLPWPDGFMAEERKAIRKKLDALDQLVRDWPSVPDDFSAAYEALMKRPKAIEYAPDLVARALVVLGAAGDRIDVKELEARRDEARALPDALKVVDEFLRVREYLEKFGDEPPDDWAPGDAATLVRARQYERQATAMLATATDATLVTPQIGPVVERASRLASRLPAPKPVTPDLGEAQPQAAAGILALVAPIVSFGRIGEALRASAVAAGPVAVIFLSLAIGVLTGLAALYNDKAWGALTDYAAAIVWGYVASTVTTPIIAVVKQLGARPRDEAAPVSGK